jgi:dipeptidyl aminopeptidase/acylaminoacyl peptidase
MKKSLLFLLCLSLLFIAQAQKKPLDHSVYDGWQSIGEKKISNDGRWVAYTVDLQEGDGALVLQSADGNHERSFARGYSGTFSADGRFLVFKVKPPYADTRQARIKKKKADDMPKDSLFMLDLQRDTVGRWARVKSFKMPDLDGEWMAVLMEKGLVDSFSIAKAMDSTGARHDSTKKAIAPIIEQQPDKKRKKKLTAKEDGDEGIADADGDANVTPESTEGTDLLVKNLRDGRERSFAYVSEYNWSRNGRILEIEGTTSKADKKSRNTVSIFRTAEYRADTISRGASDYRNHAVDEKGYRVAFVAERDSSAKALQKFWKLWGWTNGQDSATLLADKNSPGMPLSWTVSENGNLTFSKSGDRLMFGTAPITPARDTSLVEIDLVKVDVWNYKDDYLQSQQLKNLDQELKRSYAAMYDYARKGMVQLADRSVPQVTFSGEGDGPLFMGVTDLGNRVPAQWEGETLKDIYAINPADGSRTLVKKGLSGSAQLSPSGRYISWYDNKTRHYHSWDGAITRDLAIKVKPKLYDEEFDMPDSPSPYGLMRWTADDKALLVYDRYDIWQLDPNCAAEPFMVTAGEGRKTKSTYRYVQTDPEERSLKADQQLILRRFDEKNKQAGWSTLRLDKPAAPTSLSFSPNAYGALVKAKEAEVYVFTKESYMRSPDLYLSNDLKSARQLSHINPQQSQYNWGTAELVTWKAYDGKEATGVVYKPENWDPKKKYPMIAYFYEKLSDGLNNYLPPAPTPSRLNIPFFVSRGYIVLAPDIRYIIGHPGPSAYNYVVSGSRALVKKGWVDSTRIGIQGQSWGGYQVAYLITRTKLFKAAWAGAPVANMTSAYGGIRWESGLNRQFQYERTQSRIGATLWEKPELYMENSPLFHLKTVSTPLVIMSNDADGAVPWYQGIEMFTAMRRLGKPVWLLNYNGEAHNLVERRNRKDIQQREQQFFDWLLKDEKPPVWITEGVPATEKGKGWGLEIR